MNSATIIPFARETRDSAATFARYRRLYLAAKRAKYFGGIVSSGALLIAAILSYQLARAEGHGFPAAAYWLIGAAVLVALVARVWERLFAVAGDQLKVGVDMAVNTSPFLTNEQRSGLMRPMKRLKKAPTEITTAQS